MPRYFEDLKVGDGCETPGRTITAADLLGFAAISGDQESLDLTTGESGLPPRVPDLLVMAITSGLGFRAPAELPQVLAFMVMDFHPVRPVRVGDTIHCRIRVAAMRPMKDAGVVVEKREMLNQHGDVVQQAEYKIMVARRPRE